MRWLDNRVSACTHLVYGVVSGEVKVVSVSGISHTSGRFHLLLLLIQHRLNTSHIKVRRNLVWVNLINHCCSLFVPAGLQSWWRNRCSETPGTFWWTAGRGRELECAQACPHQPHPSRSPAEKKNPIQIYPPCSWSKEVGYYFNYFPFLCHYW